MPHDFFGTEFAGNDVTIKALKEQIAANITSEEAPMLYNRMLMHMSGCEMGPYFDDDKTVGNYQLQDMDYMVGITYWYGEALLENGQKPAGGQEPVAEDVPVYSPPLVKIDFVTTVLTWRPLYIYFGQTDAVGLLCGAHIPTNPAEIFLGDEAALYRYSEAFHFPQASEKSDSVDDFFG
jgi:hypothetical protein